MKYFPVICSKCNGTGKYQDIGAENGVVYTALSYTCEPCKGTGILYGYEP